MPGHDISDDRASMRALAGLPPIVPPIPDRVLVPYYVGRLAWLWRIIAPPRDRCGCGWPSCTRHAGPHLPVPPADPGPAWVES